MHLVEEESESQKGEAPGHPDSGRTDIMNTGSLAIESGSLTTILYCEKVNQHCF